MHIKKQYTNNRNLHSRSTGVQLYMPNVSRCKPQFKLGKVTNLEKL